MKFPLSLHLYVVTACWIVLVNARLELDTIRNLTSATDGYRERILEVGGVGLGLGDAGSEGGTQVVLSAGVEGDEIEDTVAAALRMLCTDILIELEKPLTTNPSRIPDYSPSEETDCEQVKTEFHDFLASTVKFLYAVQERQMIWRWPLESAVHDGVAWMQGLWASRSKNSQNRSFIEQQMSLYGETGCFGKSKEVLRKGVEIVEYLNDLMDLFA